MHMLHKHNILTSEQQVTDTNPLFDLARIPHNLQRPSQHSNFLHGELHTRTTG